MTGRTKRRVLTLQLAAAADHWLVLCLACAILWGVWGFLSKLLADRVGAVESQLLFTAGMFPAALIAAAAVGGQALRVSRRGIGYGLLNGVLTGIGTLCFFEALARGPASLVSPLVAVYPLGTVALAITVLRERISKVQAAGALCTVVGLALFAQP